MTADVAVIGGGIVGLAIAVEARRRGLATTLVDDGRAGAATNAAGGMLAPIAEADPNLAPLVPLGLESLAMYPAWLEALDGHCDLSTKGSLLVALHGDHYAELMHTKSAQEALGLTATWLEPNELLEREPKLSPRVQGALHVAEERSVDPRQVAAALATTFERLGGVRADTAEAKHVVVASGAWTEGLPIRPVKGQALRLRGPQLISHVLRTPDVYVVPRADGTMYVGATTEERGFEIDPFAGAVFEQLRDAIRVVPGAMELFVEEIVVGFRPALRDHLPAIGFLDDGRFVATGHHRNGVLLAPITAKLTIDAIEAGQAPEALAPFDPLRFTE